MVHGYSPSITGLPQTKLMDEVVIYHQEEVGRLAFNLISRSNPPKILGPKEFKKDGRV